MDAAKLGSVVTGVVFGLFGLLALWILTKGFNLLTLVVGLGSLGYSVYKFKGLLGAAGEESESDDEDEW